MRTRSHVIDSNAVKRVLDRLPEYWVVRELTERDYGIDLLVEIFIPGKKDKKNKLSYDASGAIFHIQIKGTEKPLVASPEGTVSCTLKKTSLRYFEKFSVPFFLFRTDVSSPTGKVYFIWLQRYIKDVLDVESPAWREEKDTKALSVYLPVENELSDDLGNIDRVRDIAFRPKYLEELVEYREIFDEFDNQVSAILVNKHVLNQEVIDNLRNKVRRAKRLNVLVSRNECCVNQASLDDFMKFLDQMLSSPGRFSADEEYPHQFNLRMLARSLDGMAFLESFVQENEGRTAY